MVCVLSDNLNMLMQGPYILLVTPPCLESYVNILQAYLIILCTLSDSHIQTNEHPICKSSNVRVSMRTSTDVNDPLGF